MAQISKTPIQAVLLDMDGTLFDSESFYKQLWQSTAQSFGINLTDSLYHNFFVGAHFEVGKQKITELGGKGFVLDHFLQVLVARGESHTPQLKPGARELLQWLAQIDIPVALVTSGSQISIQRNFSPYPELKVFDVVISGDDINQHKPHPEPYLAACEQLGISGEQALAVEDSNTGARSALAAGCQTLLIPDFAPFQDDLRASAAAHLDSLLQLPAWLQARMHLPLIQEGLS